MQQNVNSQQTDKLLREDSLCLIYPDTSYEGSAPGNTGFGLGLSPFEWLVSLPKLLIGFSVYLNSQTTLFIYKIGQC